MAADQSWVTLSGEVADLFGHRFVVASAMGRVLADLGPKGAGEVVLTVGDKVIVSGEQKPSEIKVDTIMVGGRTFELKGDKDHGSEAEGTALKSVREAGFEPVGRAKHRPKHFEILARRGDEQVEFHVELGGKIRKRKPAKPQAPRGTEA